MIRSFKLISTFIVISCVAGTAMAQPIGSPEMNGPDSPQRDMVALETMNNAAADNLRKSNLRIAQMKEYMQVQGILADYQAGVHGDSNADGKIDSDDLSGSLSFDQAYNVAKMHDTTIAHEQATVTPEQRRVDAYKTVVQTTWKELHAKMAEVHSMSEFLHAKGKFDDYQQWALVKNADSSKGRIAEMAAKSKAAVDARAKMDAKSKEAIAAKYAAIKKQHEKYCKTAWQHYKFNQEIYNQRLKYNEKYANGHYNGYDDGYGDVGFGGW
tara:strand:+ start:15688 stop:16494 length:807 start_codon:yes stop_codon:yes gene_type:complete